MIGSLLQCGTKHDQKSRSDRNTYIRELEKKEYREGVYVVCICSIYTVPLISYNKACVYTHNMPCIYTVYVQNVYTLFDTAKNGGFFANEC